MSYTSRPACWNAADDENAEAADVAFDGDGRGGSACEATDRKESCEDLGELGTMRDETRSAMVNSLSLRVFLSGIVAFEVYVLTVRGCFEEFGSVCAKMRGGDPVCSRGRFEGHHASRWKGYQ